MILDAIILENFGVYRGRQEAILTPEPDKPIILFCGMNGGGKTTLFDALQLALYGPKARLSNRGRRTYKEYLRESIHRGVDPGEGASVTLRFRRYIEGQARQYEIYRAWREGGKGIEENMHVFCDGLPDPILTEHWSETMENYLPSSLAHLFFFDGEQIRELAEGGNATQILGTAVHSLLGLDLVDRLEMDLKALERRTGKVYGDPETVQRIEQVQAELKFIDQEQEKLALEEGRLVNEAGRLGKALKECQELYAAEGGDIFERRKELEDERASMIAQKDEIERQLRELLAGPLPLLLVEDLLAEVEEQAQRENEIRRSRMVLEELQQRDRKVLMELKKMNVDQELVQSLERMLSVDRQARSTISQEEIVLDADEDLVPKIAHLRAEVLPTAREQAVKLSNALEALEERIERLQVQLDRVPTDERINAIQKKLESARKEHNAKLEELQQLRVRRESFKKQRTDVEAKIERLETANLEMNSKEDERTRLLQHSTKVRDTLREMRHTIVKKHAANIERLMLESFQSLLHKNNLVKNLSINPDTFEATLTGWDGNVLPFDRLSAGESQMLATSMLWGLARASGRAVPTIIDTPLGRLDSSHRNFLTERYFPHASHQVLLLSTDTEISENLHTKINQKISGFYYLSHSKSSNYTRISKGVLHDDKKK
ncbi:DNA sulfur modification protein DndD [Desulfonatronum thioautotrophicum]|uniref:DNA sulfur modification protein DndD n=1 Tax=Desulfonatronum thioautotrophicum TaxID=617001 RepID=UPI0005EBEDD9|nr:DNA sulfur modification protein DndD [Desulfonatronum thioautotrophicum]